MAWTRPLTRAEVALAERWFGDTLDPDRVRVVARAGLGGRAFVATLLHVSYVFVGREAFLRDLAEGPPVSLADRRLLLHELTHVWQAQNGAGPRSYMWVAIAHQARHGRAAYAVPRLDAPFSAYGPEQQGRIVERAVAGDEEARALLDASGPRALGRRRRGRLGRVLAATPVAEVVDAFRAPFSLRGRYGDHVHRPGRRYRMVEDD